MTRIVSGSVGGRRLTVPKGDTTRPTSERVREALFSSLEARGKVRGARVVDLFCGSGALGLEAASRGAAQIVLVDSSRAAIDTARRNVATLGLARVSVVLSSVDRYLQGRPPWRADLVLLDPPYGLDEATVSSVLARLVSGRWLDAGAVVVVERSARGPEPRWPSGLVRTGSRPYGETALWTADHVASRPASAVVPSPPPTSSLSLPPGILGLR